MVGEDARNEISKLWAGQATKNWSVNCSVEPLGAHWNEEMTNKEIYKQSMFGHIQTQKGKNELVKMWLCSNRGKTVGHEAS